MKIVAVIGVWTDCINVSHHEIEINRWGRRHEAEPLNLIDLSGYLMDLNCYLIDFDNGFSVYLIHFCCYLMILTVLVVLGLRAPRPLRRSA